MKRFWLRIAICLLPTLLAIGVVARAYGKYQQGQGGFRLGVDLVGGTILVYEIDETKMTPEALRDFKPEDLANALKRRIDPADLYQVTIRPVPGTPPRVEIILPTGGKHQAAAELHAWRALLASAADRFPVEAATIRPRAEAWVKENVDAWEKQRKQPARAGARQSWTDLLYDASREFPPGGEVDETKVPEIYAGVAEGDRKQLVKTIVAVVTESPYAGVSKGQKGALAEEIYNKSVQPRLEAWLKSHTAADKKGKKPAWKTVLAEAATAFPPGTEEGYSRIKEGDTKELAVRLEEAERVRISEWIESKTQHADKSRKMLTGEEVENIKNLIARQGRLEFRILANTEDDKAAMDAAIQTLRKADREQLLRLEQRAEPPPAPRAGGEKEGSPYFHVNLPSEPDHTYSWVEVGKGYLYTLGLNSEALQKSSRRLAEIENYERTGQAFTMGANLFCVRKITDWTRRLARDRELGKTREFFVLTRDPEKGKEITGDYLVRAYQEPDQRGRPSIGFTFNNEGGELFFEVTTKNKPSGSGETGFKRQLAVIFDGQIDSAPALQSPIRTRGIITGEFTQQEIDDHIRILRAGALPATLKKDPVSENSMGATLGADTIYWGTLSVGLAFLTVMAFMVFYYRFAGLVACVALLANLLLTVAFMVLVDAAFTLPGLAGLVLMLGMAVDANVLIYERLREERERGASLAMALRNGYDRAFPTILDTHLTSMFTAVVLYVVGNDQLKGFGITLFFGLLISLFTSLFMTRTIFEIWNYKGWLKKLSFFGGLVRLVHLKYWDFMSIRYYWFAATVTLTILGAGLFIYRADTDPTTGKATVLNIDFTGGTAFTGQLAEPMGLERLRHLLEASSDEEPLPDLSIEQVFDRDGQPRFFTVRTSDKNADKVLSYISRKLAYRDEASGKERSYLKLLQLSRLEPRYADKQHQTVSAVTLGFTNEEGHRDFASPAQVQRVIAREFTDRGKSPSVFTIERPQARKYELLGHYSELTVQLAEPMPTTEVMDILKDVQNRFRNSPQPERLEVFDKQLAANTQERALYAILASWGAILLYLWFRFGNWTFGAATVLCLIHDLFFTLGVVAACHYWHNWFGSFLGIQDFKIDLPAVAALLTLVGYSVNDTIVVFDRIREVRGKNPLLTAQMINDGVNQTLTRTLLASATVFLVVVVLYIWGGEGVKLFAFVMIVGVVVGTYSSIYIASPLLLIFGEGRSHAAGQPERIAPAPERA